jgi:hypothetical protein
MVISPFQDAERISGSFSGEHDGGKNENYRQGVEDVIPRSVSLLSSLSSSLSLPLNSQPFGLIDLSHYNIFR